MNNPNTVVFDYLNTSIQMSTTRKRKNEVHEEQHRKKVKKNLITHVKAVQEGRKGNFLYFGKSVPDQQEERLTISWLDNNHMGRSWRRTVLRGRNGTKLGTWNRVPVGSKIDEKLQSKNPCIAGTKYSHTCFFDPNSIHTLVFRWTSHVSQR